MTTHEKPDPTQKERAATINHLEQKKGEYLTRLDLGAAKIEEARAHGKNVTTWEDYWIQLLRQYEAICDKIKDLQQERN